MLSLPLRIPWAVSPAILVVIGGFIGNNHVGGTITEFGILGSPIILYLWSVVILKKEYMPTINTYVMAIILTPIMCFVNVVFGIAGCVMTGTMDPGFSM